MQVCEECFDSCLKEPDVKTRVKCISLLKDCSELKECSDIYAFSAKDMASNSDFAKDLFGVCATVCDACANECAMFKDAHCQDCADE